MVTGTAGTATAFLVTLYVAQRNYRRSREHIPSLTMSLTLSRLPISESYDVLIATLEAQNTGTGLCKIGEVRWVVLALSPYDDQTVDKMSEEYEGASEEIPPSVFPWRSVREKNVKMEMTIEPSQTEQRTQEFVIESETKAVMVSAWAVNTSQPKLTEGWLRRTAHSQREGQAND